MHGLIRVLPLLLIVSCKFSTEAPPAGADIGVLAESSQDIRAIELAIDNANIVGGVYGGVLTAARNNVDEFDSLEAAFVDLSDDQRVRAIVSTLPPEASPELARLAENYQVTVINPLGLEWWNTHRKEPPYWEFGLTGPTVSALTVIAQYIAEDTEGVFPCTSVGLLLHDGDRSEDMAIADKIVAAHSLDFAGIKLVSDGAVQDTWQTVPSCVMVEQGLHVEATRAFASQLTAGTTKLIYIDLREATEFSEDPDLVTQANSQMTIQSSNGPTEGRNITAFEEMYVRHTGGTRPTWQDGYYFDAGMIAALAIATGSTRSDVQTNVPLVATNVFNEVLSNHNTPVRVNSLPRHFSDGVNGFWGAGQSPDYRGVSGAINYPGLDADERNSPEQEYKLYTINDLVVQDLTLVKRFTTNDTGSEFGF